LGVLREFLRDTFDGISVGRVRSRCGSPLGARMFVWEVWRGLPRRASFIRVEVLVPYKS